MWTLEHRAIALFAMQEYRAEYFDKESLINSLPTIRFNSDTIELGFEMYLNDTNVEKSEL
jgi:hypothetical protein